MGALFSRQKPEEGESPWVAPPPQVLPPPTEEMPFPDVPGAAPPPSASRPKLRQFDTEVDCCELDDRERPGNTWAGRAIGLSRSNIVIRSRRMTYVGRRILVAVHLIDERPVPLLGRVRSCEYDTEGMYRLDLDLLPLPEMTALKGWLASLHR